MIFAGNNSSETTFAPSGNDSGAKAGSTFLIEVEAQAGLDATTAPFVIGTETNCWMTAPFVALKMRTIPSDPPATIFVPSGLNAME